MSTSPCYSFHPGHNIHHQTIEKFNQPRTLVDVSHVMDNAFLVTFNGFTEFWYHHNPKRLMDSLTRSMPEGIEATEDKKFLFVYTGTLIERFNMAQTEITKCIQIAGPETMHPAIASTIRKIHATNVRKLIERGISA
jgi:hypothetical protein